LLGGYVVVQSDIDGSQITQNGIAVVKQSNLSISLIGVVLFIIVICLLVTPLNWAELEAAVIPFVVIIIFFDGIIYIYMYSKLSFDDDCLVVKTIFRERKIIYKDISKINGEYGARSGRIMHIYEHNKNRPVCSINISFHSLKDRSCLISYLLYHNPDITIDGIL